MAHEAISKKVLKIKWIQLGCDDRTYYDNVLIKASSNLHEEVYSIIKKLKDSLKDKKMISILDVAAGEGAFSKRMYDRGFAVEAIDFDADSFKYNEIIPFYKINLNSEDIWKDFINLNKNRYDVVISIETIEHLENPWMFLRGLKDLVKPEGYIILTTPNIKSPSSKVLFSLKNRFLLFREKNLECGHINPLTSFELSTICKNIGLNLKGIYPGGLYPIIWIHPRHLLFSVAWSLINGLSLPFVETTNFSMCKIYLIQNLGIDTCIY